MSDKVVPHRGPMSIDFGHTDEENRWHAEIFNSLSEEIVTPGELEDMAAETSQWCSDLRHETIRRILEKHSALAALPELARRCAIVPEVLDGPGDDLETGIEQRLLLLALEDLISAGYVEVRGQGARRRFRLSEKGLRERPKLVKLN